MDDTEDRVGCLIERYASLISAEDSKEMNHFWQHREWEMAYEILILGLMNQSVPVQESDAKEMLDVAIACGFRDDGGVFDFSIFKRLEDWVR